MFSEALENQASKILNRKIMYSKDEYIVDIPFIAFFLVRGRLAVRTPLNETLIKKILSSNASGEYGHDLSEKHIGINIEYDPGTCDKFFCSSKILELEREYNELNLHDEILNLMLSKKENGMLDELFYEKQKEICEKLNFSYNKVKGDEHDLDI